MRIHFRKRFIESCLLWRAWLWIGDLCAGWLVETRWKVWGIRNSKRSSPIFHQNLKYFTEVRFQNESHVICSQSTIHHPIDKATSSTKSIGKGKKEKENNTRDSNVITHSDRVKYNIYYTLGNEEETWLNSQNRRSKSVHLPYYSRKYFPTDKKEHKYRGDNTKGNRGQGSWSRSPHHDAPP